MSTLNLIIRKINLSEFANADYFVNMNQLVSLPLQDQQIEDLVKFMIAANDVKAAYRTMYQDDTEWTATTAFGPIQIIGANSLEGYALFGSSDLSKVKILFNSNVYKEYLEARSSIFSFLGWSAEPDKVIEIEANYDEVTFTWDVSFSNSYITSRLDQALDLQTVLGNL